MYMIRPQIAIWADERSTCQPLARAIIEIARDMEHAQMIWAGEDREVDYDAIVRRAFDLTEDNELWWGSYCEVRPLPLGDA